MSEPSRSSPSPFVKCPGCGAKLSVRAEDAGRRGECHECGKVFRIGGALASVSSATVDAAVARQEPRPLDAPPVSTAPAPSLAIDNDHLHPVVCEVCQTLMYATDDQVGTKVKCPDCGRPNLAKPREKKRTKRVIVPDGDEYQLDETTSPPPTPRFTPIEEREAQFRAAARARLGVAGPAVDPSEPGAKKSGGKASTEQQGSSQASATPPSPAPSPSTTRAQRRSRRDRDPRRPAVPVVQGVLRMMFTAEVMVRWMTLSFVLCGILFLILQVMGAMGNQALYMLPLFAGGCILAGIWLLSAAPLFIAITTQSSDGNDELSDPPGWLALEFAEAAYLVMAVIISALPAWLATKAAVGVPLEGRLAIGAGVWLLIFPFVVLSSLEQGSALAIFSLRLATSYFRCFVPWLVFYLTSALLVAGAAALAGYLLSRGSLIALIPIPWLIVALILIYMRMIGRLGWWIADVTPPPAEEEAD